MTTTEEQRGLDDRPMHEVAAEYARDAARMERERDAARAELADAQRDYDQMLAVAQDTHRKATTYRVGRTEARMGLAGLGAAVEAHVRERHDEPTPGHHANSAAECVDCGPLLRAVAAARS